MQEPPVMSKHGTITLELDRTGDDEADAVALAVKAIEMLRDVDARRRVADYLRDRYDVKIEVVNGSIS